MAIMWNYYIKGLCGKMPEKGTCNLVFAFLTKNGEVAGKPRYYGILHYCEDGRFADTEGNWVLSPWTGDDGSKWEYKVFAWYPVRLPTTKEMNAVQEMWEQLQGEENKDD